jgi:proline dehydrogenase
VALEAAYRRTVLAVSETPAVRSLVTRVGWRLGVGRFVAGEDFEAALPALRRLTAEGKRLVLDVLGEFVGDEAAARAAARRILAALEAAAAADLEPYMSVKPTQLGLGVDPGLALELASQIAQRSAALHGHLCLDMESTPYVERTLALLERLRAGGHAGVSTVLQSYLHRTPEDLERLIAADPRQPVRLVKGAYREGADVALQRKADVDDALRRLVFRGLDAGMHVNLASHDERVLAETAAYVRGAGLARERYEFQLLFGVSPTLQGRLLEAGHSVRIYVPFGRDWYGYFSRRLAERPANVAFVIRGLFG